MYLYEYMYVYLYVCTYIRRYMYIYVHARIFINIFINISTNGNQPTVYRNWQLRICVFVKTGNGHCKDAEFGIHTDNP